MATSPLGGFANLSQYQNQVAAQKAANPGALNSLIQGFQQGLALEQLPQQLQAQDLASQVALALQQAKLQQLQTGEVQNVGGRLVRYNPQTGQPEVILDAAPTAGTPENQQLVGFSSTGQPMVFSPRSGTLRAETLPAGVNISGPLLPKTQTPESQQFIGFQGGVPVQFGSRGSGVTPAPIQQGLDLTGPLQPRTQAPKTKQILAINESTGRITNVDLSADEELPQGFKPIEKKSAEDYKSIDSFRKEITSNPVVKQFGDISKSKTRIDDAMKEAAETNNFLVVDQALISSFNRLLEPDSVTMVSEYARTSADAPLINRLSAGLTRPIKGGRLAQEDRDALARLSNRIYQTSLGNYSKTIDYFEGIGERRGWNPADFIQPLGIESSAPATAPAPSSTPKVIRITPRNP